MGFGYFLLHAHTHAPTHPHTHTHTHTCTVNMSAFCSFGESAGDAQLPEDDDISSDPINLTVPILFFGRIERTLFVSL